MMDLIYGFLPGFLVCGGITWVWAKFFRKDT